MINDDENDDIWMNDEEQGRRHIAAVEMKSKNEECFDVGYHGGLIGTLEDKQKEVLLFSIEGAFQQARKFYSEIYQDQAQEALLKYISEKGRKNENDE